VATQTPIMHLPVPQSTDSADVPRDMGALANALDPLGYVPVGALMMWPAVNAPADVDPAGHALWLVCNGQVVLATDYPKLATVLGQAAGNVTVPDLRGRVALGVSATHPLNEKSGAEAVALTAPAQLPAHQHSAGSIAAQSAGAHGHTLSIDAAAVTPASYPWFPVHDSSWSWVAFNATVQPPGVFPVPTMLNGTIMNYTQGAHAHTGSAVSAGAHTHATAGDTTPTGAGATHENMPPFLAINYIIRAG